MSNAEGRKRVLADMASLGMAGELEKVKRYRRIVDEPSAATVHANKHEVKAQRKGKAKVPKVKPSANDKAMAEHTRDRPTKERVARGVFERIDAARFDTTRAGDKILMDWKARAGGAGEMYLRGQLSRREADAAAELMELLEMSQASGLSCGEVRERVEGGKVDLSGGRLTAASKAWGKYQDALGRLSRWGRILVEKRVVEGMAMAQIVALPSLADAVGEISERKRCDKAIVLLRGALDHLADHFHLPGA